MTKLMKMLLLLGSVRVVSPLTAMAATNAPASTAAVIPDITIVRKTGQEDGVAQMMVKNKVRKITPHAVQAWPVRNGQAALILVLDKKGSAPKQYLLRYYDLDSGRRRVLGTVPLSGGTMQESKSSEGIWAFALSGKDLTTAQPVTIVGDDEAIPGIIPGAVSPSFSGDDLTYISTPGNEKQTIKTVSLLGTSLSDIYSPPQSSIVTLKYLQIFTNGTAMTVSNDGVVHQGHWQTDGKTIDLTVDNAKLSFAQASLEPVKGIPAGTYLSVRLLQPLSSHTTKEGARIAAISINPVVIHGDILIPNGSTITGTVVQANGVGWGFKHETASLTIEWDHAILPDGRDLPLHAHTSEVENAQEKVNPKGKIQGIRSTGTPGYSAENAVLSFAGVDPIAYVFASAAGSGVLGFAEPEILYNAGTELVLEYNQPVITSQTYSPTVLPAATTTDARQQLQDFVHKLPYRTATQFSNKPSDLTNLVFIGSPQSVERAFAAAGWLAVDELNSSSTVQTIKTLSGNHVYTQAPMSMLLLDERKPLFTYSKTTNTFFSRHHLRIFPTVLTDQGSTVLTASSTQDIGIAFSKKQKTFIHVIDEHIDNERSKIVNDLTLTGCVDSVDMIPRPWLPEDAYNSTGDRLFTDREVAILRINSCDAAKTTPHILASAPPRAERITRDTSLTIRNSVYRGNLIYQGISGTFAVRNYLHNSSELPQNYGAWLKTDSSGARYAPLRASKDAINDRTTGELEHRPEKPTLETSPEDLAAMRKAKDSHKWDPPRYELSLEGGYLHMRETDLSYVDILLLSEENPVYYELDLQDQVNDGWTAGGTVTVNSWKHFSNEFSYFRQQGKYTLGLGAYIGDASLPPGEDDNEDSAFASARIGIITRQFEYNLLYHFRKPESRWRPYIAAGPAFQLISLSDAPLKKPAGVYTLGLKNIGLIKAAFDFGNTPPLDGGGIFQLGLVYGAGIKYRVTPHFMMRADYRETWSKNPDIIKNSYEDLDIDVGDDSYTSDVIVTKPLQKFFQDRFTLGASFTF
jgi:opacity protein-like surface antigen